MCVDIWVLNSQTRSKDRPSLKYSSGGSGPLFKKNEAFCLPSSGSGGQYLFIPNGFEGKNMKQVGQESPKDTQEGFQLKIFSTFSGVGGFERGIEKAFQSYRLQQEQGSKGVKDSGGTKGIDKQLSRISWNKPHCVGYSEFSKYPAAIYQYHYPDTKNWKDITKIKETDLPDFDFLVGGPSCQAFLIAGLRLGFEDTRGTLFFDVCRILKAKKPRFFLLENVKGLISHDSGRTLKTIVASLAECGYCVEWQVFNSKLHRVPQNRERIYFAGYLGGPCSRTVFPLRQIGETFDEAVGVRGVCSDEERVEEGLSDTDSQVSQDGKNRPICGGGEPSFTLTAQDRHGVADGKRIRRLTPVECFTDRAFIMGSNKSIRDVVVGDTVIGQNGLQHVAHVFKREYIGKLYTVKTQGALPIEVTGEHRVLVCKRQPKSYYLDLSEPYWEEVQNLIPRVHYMLYPKIGGFDSTTTISLKKYVSTYHNIQKAREYRNLPSTIVLTNDVCWLLGLCVADGCTGKLSVEICLGSHERTLITKARNILKRMGFRSSVFTSGNCTKVVCSSAIFSRFLEEHIGKLAPNKKIPEFILFHKNKDFCFSFLDGYFCGDGHERLIGSGSHKKECSTVSVLLAHQLQLLLSRLGIFSSIYRNTHTSGMIMGRKCNVLPVYCVSYIVKNKWHVRYKQLKNYIAAPIQKITQCEFDGCVYNLETKDNTYIVSNLVVHNCSRLQSFGDTWCDFGKFEDGSIKPISDTQKYHALGNAVTTTVVEDIMLSFIPVMEEVIGREQNGK